MDESTRTQGVWRTIQTAPSTSTVWLMCRPSSILLLVFRVGKQCYRKQVEPISGIPQLQSHSRFQYEFWGVGFRIADRVLSIQILLRLSARESITTLGNNTTDRLFCKPKWRKSIENLCKGFQSQILRVKLLIMTEICVKQWLEVFSTTLHIVLLRVLNESSSVLNLSQLWPG